MKTYNEILQYIKRMRILIREEYIEEMVRLICFIYDKTMEQIFQDMEDIYI